MKENLIIKKYRGSIFLTQDIAPDKELIKELSELLGISQATIVENHSLNKSYLPWILTVLYHL